MENTNKTKTFRGWRPSKKNKNIQPHQNFSGSYFSLILCINSPFRSSHRRCSVRKGILINFAEPTGIHVYTCARVSILRNEFCKIFKNTFFTERFETTASDCLNLILLRWDASEFTFSFKSEPYNSFSNKSADLNVIQTTVSKLI